MCHTPHSCHTWPMYVNAQLHSFMTHSCRDSWPIHVIHDPFMLKRNWIHSCHTWTIHANVWHDSFMSCMDHTWPIHVNAQLDSFMSYMTHSWVIRLFYITYLECYSTHQDKSYEVMNHMRWLMNDTFMSHMNESYDLFTDKSYMNKNMSWLMNVSYSYEMTHECVLFMRYMT